VTTKQRKYRQQAYSDAKMTTCFLASMMGVLRWWISPRIISAARIGGALEQTHAMMASNFVMPKNNAAPVMTMFSALAVISA